MDLHSADTVESDVPAKRIAILSDVHGNLPAFQAVLADIEQGRASTSAGAWATWSATAPSPTSAWRWPRSRAT